MRIIMLGLNHRTASLEVREKLVMQGQVLDNFYARMHQLHPVTEMVVLSTCNRVEIYLARPAHAQPSIDTLRQMLSDATGASLAEVTAATIHRENDMALSHLFGVATGLDSMVIGEHQIMGQVRQAYEKACDAKAVGPVLHKVFQQAIAVARHVRSETGIDAGRVSVGSVAVDFARQIFEHFQDKTIVGIGAGYMAKLTLKHLQALQPAKLWLVNRSPERARTLADSLAIGSPASPGGPRSMDDLDALLVEADIMLTSTSASEYIITAPRLGALLKQRRSRPLFLIDIAVPRDIDPAVASLRNVYLYNVDDLQAVVSQTHEQRLGQVEHCQRMLTKAVAQCMHQVQHRDAGQLIKALRARLHELGKAEQARTVRKMQSSTSQDPEALIAEHTHRLINKILHLPLSQFDHHHNADAPLGFYTAALRRLFQLDTSEDHGPDALDELMKLTDEEARDAMDDVRDLADDAAGQKED